MYYLRSYVIMVMMATAVAATAEEVTDTNAQPAACQLTVQPEAFIIGCHGIWFSR